MEATPAGSSPRRLRADAQRNLDALLDAAKAVFAESGIEAAGQEIADRAGVGIGTMYRHFPRRSDLVAAVLTNEIDACAAAAISLTATKPAREALIDWVQLLTELVGTKQGLASALHSEDPALSDLSEVVRNRLEPSVEALLHSARAAGVVRPDVGAGSLISAVALLCHPVPGQDRAYNQQLVAVFLDGLLREPSA